MPIALDTLREVLGQAKRDTISESFIIDHQKISDPKLIADYFTFL